MNISQKSYSRKSSLNPSLIITIMILTLIISVIIAVFLGSTNISISDVLKAVRNSDTSDIDYRILVHLRLPRVLAAVFSGSALAASGVIIQAVLGNAMASPNIIGVNSGAGLFVILFITFSPASYSYLPAAAFFGALFACLLIYTIATITGAGKMTITLVGIAISSIFSAGITTVKTVFPNSMYDSNSFMVGGLSAATLKKLIPAIVVIMVSLIIVFFFAKDIDVLNLGETTAKTLGMKVGLTRFILIILACALAGSAVSFSGLISFVGLIVPHICRKLVGNRHHLLLPTSAIGGATLVVICDIFARVLFAPYEIPVGIILSFIGGPFFIFLILLQRKKSSYD